MLNRRQILLGILVCCGFVCGSLAGCAGTSRNNGGAFSPATEFDAPRAGFVTVARDGDALLEIDPGTMDIRYTKGGKIWSSAPFSHENPETRDAEYDSLFVIKGAGKSGTEFVFDSFAACIARSQYEVSFEGGRMKAVFTAGDLNPRIILPEMIRVSVMEEQILSKLDEREQKRFLRRYNLLSPEDAADEEKESLLKEYPALKEDDLYLIASDVTEREKRQLQDAAREVGYTEEMLDAEYRALGFSEGGADSSPAVEITILFGLEDGDFVAEIPKDGIRYDSEKYIVHRIDFLKNFAAKETAAVREILIPDGIGAVIEPSKAGFGLGKVSKRVYGENDSPDPLSTDTCAPFPVFGFSTSAGSLFAIIEEGEALAEITADYFGAFSNAYAGFEYQAGHVQSTLDGWQNILINNFNPEPPRTAMKVRYKMLERDASYTDMARVYREYLIKTGALSGRREGSLPLYVETLGSVDANGRFLMFPVNRAVALTEYRQNAEILETLNKAGITNIHLKLTAAANGGLQNSVLRKAKLSGPLGGKKGFEQLKKTAADYGAKLYLNGEFARVYRDGATDGFRPSRDAARSITGRYAMSGVPNQASGTLIETGKAYLLRPDLLPDLVKGYFGAEVLRGVGASMGALGEALIPNYDEKRIVNRQETLEYYKKALQAAASRDEALMVSGAGAYVLPFAEHILNVPGSGSELNDYTQTVPFVPMVLHGMKNYALVALNRTDDFRTAVLKCIETGSSVHVVLAAQNARILRTTGFSHYLSVDRETWLPRAMSAHAEVQNALEGVAGQTMVSHRRISDDFYETGYENGIRILVNYGDGAKEYEGVTVDAMGYLVLRP